MRKFFPVRFLAAGLIAGILSIPLARADHESAETILNQWQRWQGKLYEFKPAKIQRDLPLSQNQHLVNEISSPAKRIANDGLGVVVIENGKLVVEVYGSGADRDSKVNAYSMTKSLTALAIGEAYCAGHIKNLDDPASKYAHELIGTAYGAASIRNLLKYMSGAVDPGGNGYSGIHNLNDFIAVIRYQLTLLDLIKKNGEVQLEQGKKFIYNGLDSEALSLVARGATGKPLPQWFEETVWQKAGGEFPLGWFVDSKGNGIAEALLLASTRDFARIGVYVLDRVAGKADEPCQSEFMQEAVKPLAQKGYWPDLPYFGLGMHVGNDGNIWFSGHGGQRVGINVAKGRVVAVNSAREHRGFHDSVRNLLVW